MPKDNNREIIIERKAKKEKGNKTNVWTRINVQKGGEKLQETDVM